MSKKNIFINSIILLTVSILLLSTQVEKEQEAVVLTGAVKASYFSYLEQEQLYYFIALIIFSVLYMIVQKPRFKFENGLFLVAANIAIFASYLSALYSRYLMAIVTNYENSQTVIDDPLIALRLTNLSTLLAFSVIIFITRCWSKSLANEPQIGSKFSFIFLILITIIIQNRLNGIKYTNVHIEKAVENHNIAIKEIYLQTEEMTARHVKENPGSWGAHFIRAQFLWETGRTNQSIPYYKKALELMDNTEDELIKLIKERVTTKN